MLRARCSFLVVSKRFGRSAGPLARGWDRCSLPGARADRPISDGCCDTDFTSLRLSWSDGVLGGGTRAYVALSGRSAAARHCGGGDGGSGRRRRPVVSARDIGGSTGTRERRAAGGFTGRCPERTRAGDRRAIPGAGASRPSLRSPARLPRPALLSSGSEPSETRAPPGPPGGALHFGGCLGGRPRDEPLSRRAPCRCRRSPRPPCPRARSGRPRPGCRPPRRACASAR